MAGNSQNSFTGTVKIKNTDIPLAGAIIYLPDLNQGTITSAEGKFRFNNLPAGNFLVEIKNLGYKTFINQIKIAGNVTAQFQLEESAVEMDEVLVTGSVSANQRIINPIPVSTITTHDLERSSSHNLIESMTRIAGFSRISTGNAISKPVIRGLGYNRVLVLNDNIRQEGQQWGDEHGVEIDDNSVAKVEIIKGPGSLIYGSDALAGVLNFISTPTLPEGTINADARLNYRSNSNLMDYSANTQGNVNGFNWLVRGTYKIAGNYKNKYDDLVHNSGFNAKNLNGYLGLTKTWGYTFLRFATFNQELGIIEGERNEEGRFLTFITETDGTVAEIPVAASRLKQYYIDIPKQAIHHNRVQINSKILLGDGNLYADLGYQNNIRKEYANVEDPSETELNFWLNTFNYQLKYDFTDRKNWKYTTGINGMRQENLNKGEEQLIPDYLLNDIGAYFTTQKTWEKFHLSGGIRFDNRFINSDGLLENDAEYKFEPFKKHFSNVTLGIGGSHTISEKTTVKLNYSNGFRAPNMAELATNGKHEGTFRYEYGNKNLKPELSHQFDAGVVYTTHHVSFEANTFFNNVRHFIYLNRLQSSAGTDSIPDPSDPAPAFKYNQGNAILFGGEISIDVHPHPFDFLHLQQSFSIVRGLMPDQPDSMRNLPFIPAPNYRAEIRLQKIRIKQLHNPYISLEYNYHFKQSKIFSAFGTESETEAYGLINFSFGSEVRSRENKTIASVHFAIDNILNTAYQDHLSRLKYAPENVFTHRKGIYNPGRNFSVKLEIPFKLKESKYVED